MDCFYEVFQGNYPSAVHSDVGSFFVFWYRIVMAQDFELSYDFQNLSGATGTPLLQGNSMNAHGRVAIRKHLIVMRGRVRDGSLGYERST